MEVTPMETLHTAKKGKKKQQYFSGDIAFNTRNGNNQIIPCLNKRLKTVSETILGLQYIWEYRSPSRSVPPHYQCKLCSVCQLQNEITPHVIGWKHAFRYMKKHHADKVPFEEEAVSRDNATRKSVKAIAAEIEKTEGRGQVKVVTKEPFEIEAFKSMKSAHPNPILQDLQHPPNKRFKTGPFPEPLFQFRGGRRSDFPPDMLDSLDNLQMRRGHSGIREFVGFGGYGNGMSGASREMMESEDMHGFADDGYINRSLGPRNPNEGFGRPFPNNSMNNGDRMMGHGSQGSENNSIPATLLKYLDSFRIENEDDAQIVLKVTQKLTDILMEYRLRSISSMPTVNPLPSMDMPAISLPRMSDRHSGRKPGPSRYFK